LGIHKEEGKGRITGELYRRVGTKCCLVKVVLRGVGMGRHGGCRDGGGHEKHGRFRSNTNTLCGRAETL
jgi:hypothetical protein